MSKEDVYLCQNQKKTNRLVENFQIWDFEITKEEVEEISALNKDYQYIVESKTCPGI